MRLEREMETIRVIGDRTRIPARRGMQQQQVSRSVAPMFDLFDGARWVLQKGLTGG